MYINGGGCACVCACESRVRTGDMAHVLTLSVPAMQYDITNFNAILRHTNSLIRDRKG